MVEAFPDDSVMQMVGVGGSGGHRGHSMTVGPALSGAIPLPAGRDTRIDLRWPSTLVPRHLNWWGGQPDAGTQGANPTNHRWTIPGERVAGAVAYAAWARPTGT